FHVPKRMARELKSKDFRLAIDQNFSEVIRACALGETRSSPKTWITQDLAKAFIEFHLAGFAHSFECYDAKDHLVGGMYGVSLGGMFVGESMFYRESGASKAALIFAVQYLQS